MGVNEIRMRMIELPFVYRYMIERVEAWNRVDDRITILTLKALDKLVHHSLSTPETGVAVALIDGEYDEFLGLSWTLKLKDEWRSGTIIDHSIRKKGYGSALIRFKVALFTDRTGEKFPHVSVNPNNKASWALWKGIKGVTVVPNPEGKEI